MATEQAIAELLRSNPPAEQIRPYCHLDEKADALMVHFRNEPDYSKRLNDHVTLYLSLENDQIVGCRIKNISDILADLPNFVRVQHRGVELAVIFWSFRGSADSEDQRRVLKELAREATEHDLVLPAQTASAA
jgi:hypothetical protein